MDGRYLTRTQYLPDNSIKNESNQYKDSQEAQFSYLLYESQNVEDRDQLQVPVSAQLSLKAGRWLNLSVTRIQTADKC